MRIFLCDELDLPFLSQGMLIALWLGQTEKVNLIKGLYSRKREGGVVKGHLESVEENNKKTIK